MANREHPTIRIVADDTILLASSLIPGNENSVGQVINGLSRLGATVVHKSTALVHVSGHAPAGELRYLLNAVRPKNLMPVHGEWRHLRAHAAIARSIGLPDERIMLAENGTVVDLRRRRGLDRRHDPGRLRLRRRPGGRRHRRRRRSRTAASSARRGSCRSWSRSTSRPGKVVFGPEITARGFTDDPAALEPIRAELIEVVEKAVADGVRDADALAHIVRRTVGPLGRPDLPAPADADADGRSRSERCATARSS